MAEEKPRFMEEKVDRILDLVTGMYRVLCDTERPMTLDEIAQFWGVSKRSLYSTRRYLLPDFGRHRDGEKRKTYTRGEFMEWASLGREELKRRYMQIGSDE